MKKSIIFLIFLSFLTFSSCKKSSHKTETPTDSVTIGTFNMEWLGDGERDRVDRTEDDYKQIAEILMNTGIEVLGIQEIENIKAIDRVLKYMPDYKCVLGKGGKAQNVGLIYKDGITVNVIGEYEPLEVETGRTRPGLVATVKKGNFDWVMMVVHLKSTSHYDDSNEKQDESRSIREAQCRILRHWGDSVINAGNEKDVIIVGDFNDTPIRKKLGTLDDLYNDSNFKFLTDSLKSCKYSNLYVIDHIVVSNSALTRLLPQSRMVHDFFSSLSKDKTKKVSDHCPVSVIFDVKNVDKEVQQTISSK